MDRHQGRVLVRVSQVFTNILENQLVAFRLHEGIHERGQVEIWPAVEIQLVLDNLMHGLWVCTGPWDPEFWHLGASRVAGAIDVVMGRSLVGTPAVVALFVEGGDEFIGINLERC